MKTMKKSMGMNKMLGTIKRRATAGIGGAEAVSGPQGDSPEAMAFQAVKQFCSAGSDSGVAAGDEVLYLPTIVDAAESSPAASAECAKLIRKFLARENISRPSLQYNAIMLLRILTDNPNIATFTRNFDKKFVDTAKDLLKYAKDPSVRTILVETLDSFEYTKSYDEGLALLIEMWKKEKPRVYKNYGNAMPPQQLTARTLNAPPFQPTPSDTYFTSSQPSAPRSSRLPDAVQLAARLEEAQTSAKLLTQVVSNTPPQEILDNDLVKEFAGRCQRASRSIQGYMTAENPAPDNDTMENLLDTNEQLQTALNTHQRAVLSARKQLGISSNNSPSQPGTPSPDLPLVSGANNGTANGSGSGSGGAGSSRAHASSSRAEGVPPPPPPRDGAGKGKGAVTPYAASTNDDPRDPFRDPQDEPVVGPRPKASISGDDLLRLGSLEVDFNKYALSGSAGGSGSSNRAGKERETVDTTTDDDDLYDSAPRQKHSAGGSSSRP